MEKLRQQKKFSIVRRAKSFTHAGRGIWVLLKTTHNAWIHLVVLVITTFFGVFYEISHTEWILLLLAAGMVLAAEAYNTAIEIDVDLTSPEFHPYARDTKDVAAGAVLITAVVAAMVGVLVFYPYVSLNW